MFFPSKKQYSKWSVPSKWSYISGVLAVIGLFLTFYFGCWHKGNRQLGYDDIEKVADVIISRVLEGSPLCCDIKTAEIIFELPEEGEISVSAEDFLGHVPDSIVYNSLSFSYSTNIEDSVKIFDCKMVGKKEISIYYFLNNKLFCSKPAVFNLNDPDDFCSVLLSRKFRKNQVLNRN